MNLLDPNFDVARAAAGRVDAFVAGDRVRLKPLPEQYETYCDWMDAMPGELYCGWDSMMDDMADTPATITGRSDYHPPCWIVRDARGDTWTLPEPMMEVA